MSEHIEKEDEFRSEPEDVSKKSRETKKFNSELSFLLDLLLNEKLSRSVKEKITDRVRDVEATMQKPSIMVANPMPLNVPAPGAPLAFHPTAGYMPPPPPLNQTITQGSTVNPNISGGQAVQEALRARQHLLNQGDKPMPGESGPRKYRGG